VHEVLKVRMHQNARPVESVMPWAKTVNPSSVGCFLLVDHVERRCCNGKSRMRCAPLLKSEQGSLGRVRGVQ